MSLSIFEIFKIGIGPSSSHTMGPMKAAEEFIQYIDSKNLLENIKRVRINLYGSLASTGGGHGTLLAIILGLKGCSSQNISPHKMSKIIDQTYRIKFLNLLQKQRISFELDRDFILNPNKELPRHPNGMRFTALDANENIIYKQVYYSIGGGFLGEKHNAVTVPIIENPEYNYSSMIDLLNVCTKHSLSIAEVVCENEKVWRPKQQIDKEIRKIWEQMQSSIENGLHRKGKIHGTIKLTRRSPALHNKLKRKRSKDPLKILDWVHLWALACAEENASYGKLVTAPTNGAAAVIPAVLKYYNCYCSKASFEGIKRFIFTAGAIGILCKQNATISGAEGGCQAEMGTACAMAAAGLVAALGGKSLQCENAAIIGLTHNLGLTCDPVAGLVQVPCIERNAINAIKSISAARLALQEQGSVFLTLDQVIATMKETGQDMHCKYRETSTGGLAIHGKKGRENICSCNKECACNNVINNI